MIRRKILKSLAFKTHIFHLELGIDNMLLCETNKLFGDMENKHSKTISNVRSKFVCCCTYKYFQKFNILSINSKTIF